MSLVTLTLRPAAAVFLQQLNGSVVSAAAHCIACIPCAAMYCIRNPYAILIKDACPREQVAWDCGAGEYAGHAVSSAFLLFVSGAAFLYVSSAALKH